MSANTNASMNFRDIIKNSPLRVFDKSIGGLKNGQLGVLVSRSGTGKTGCIVHIATDALMQGKKIVHVSFSENVKNTIDWYREVFKQIAAATGKSSEDVYDEVSRNRVILSFPSSSPIESVLKTISAVMEAQGGDVSTVILDGYRLTVAKIDDIKAVKDYAKEKGINIWASVTPVRKEAKINEYGIPDTIDPYMDYIDVLVGLKTDEKAERVRMTIAKADGKTDLKSMKVSLDPMTMLIVEN
ncbi:MAG TPA: hypothetical protein DCO86_02005 [Spirochaetaceae bacterium]|nr:hypothetical protein [Spirochaetaceae bacterium]